MAELFVKKYNEWFENEMDRKELCRIENITFIPSIPPTPFYAEMDMKIIYEEEFRNRKTIIKNKIKENTLTEIYPHLTKCHSTYTEAEKIREKNKKQRKGFLFITISPMDENYGEKFINEIKSIFSWSWVNEMYFVLEQRGDTEEDMGRGAHTHILITDWDNEPSKAEKQILEKFKKYVSPNLYGKKLKEVINFQTKKFEWLGDKMEYILGKKTDEGKPEKQTIDKLWRKKNNYENYYHFDNSTDKKELSINGGKRKNCGVKKGTKRGPYKKKQNNAHLTPIENEIKVVNEKVKISF